MAISLNEGSFGLLMDPLNGAADIEARTLRLVSNYGFLEDPSLLIRATRYRARLGWDLDPKTLTRYENAKGEGVIERLSDEARRRELEQIGHEDDGLKVLRAFEEEGWMRVLFPPWTSAKADEEKLKALHDLAVELLLQGVRPDMSAAQMQLLTAKLAPKDLAALKKLLLRPGFVEEWNRLDAMADKFAKVLLSKENSSASAGFKLFTSYDPEAVLWLGFTSKDKAVQERFNQFLKVWPEARQRTPHALMQEMRITPELATYKQIVQAIFLELIDGKLITPEEMRAFLEPHSPPAPPPQVTVKRPRAKRGEAKLKERTLVDDEEAEDPLDEDEDVDDLRGDDDEVDLGLNLPKADRETEIGEDLEPESAEDDLEDETEPEPAPSKRSSKSSAAPAPAKAGTAAANNQAPQKKANTGSAAVPAKPSTPGVERAAKASVSGKDEKTTKKAIAGAATTPAGEPVTDVKSPRLAAEELTPGVKPPQTSAAPTSGTATVHAPGLKPPQALGSQAMMARPTGQNASGFKPPQVLKAKALTAKPAGDVAPGVKPAKALKAKTVKVKPKPAVKAKAVAAKPVKPKVKAKAAPVKKPASKPAPKPMKKVAPKAKGKKPAPKKGKKR
jgi:hypothetical protein